MEKWCCCKVADLFPRSIYPITQWKEWRQLLWRVATTLFQPIYFIKKKQKTDKNKLMSRTGKISTKSVSPFSLKKKLIFTTSQTDSTQFLLKDVPLCIRELRNHIFHLFFFQFYFFIAALGWKTPHYLSLMIYRVGSNFFSS